MFKLILIVLILVSGINAFGQDGLPVGKVYRKPEAQVVTYSEAYYQSEKTGNPFMIIMTSESCGPCQTLKKTIIPSMFKNGKLKNILVTYVDVDNEEELSSKLLSSKSIPEIIVFKKRLGIWGRRQLLGLQTEESIQKLIGE